MKTERLREKPFPVQLYAHWLHWDRNRASAVIGQRLITSNMIRPQFCYCIISILYACLGSVACNNPRPSSN